MTSIEWSFRKMQRGEINADPVQEEFFTPKEGKVDGLVREGDQNTLDAQVPGQQVRVCYTFSNQPLKPDIATKYLSGLNPHLASCGIPLGEPLTAMDYLVIEDFGTRGLQGDPEQDGDDPPGTAAEQKNHFYYFWRNIGRSSKGDTDRGRWGLGKTVFPAASRIRTFFGLTIRKSDGKDLLMGQSVLKVHNTDNKRYSPYGYFGLTDKEGFTSPVSAKQIIDAFKADFQLSRKTEPGLSLVIPYPHEDEIHPEQVLRSTIRNYFYPILAGDLVVEVRDGAFLQVLSRETLRDVTNSLDWNSESGGSAKDFKEKLFRLFDFAKWSIALPDSKLVVLKQQTLPQYAPIWGEDLIPEEALPRLREQYERGERIALKVPVKVERVSLKPRIASFRVFLEKDPKLPRGEDHYVRQGITITEIQRLRSVPGVRGLLVVDDKELTSLLGDAENPAHTDWQEKSTKIREGYKHGPSCVRFVRNSLREITSFLTAPPQGLKEDLLKDLFFVETPTASSEGHDQAQDNGETTSVQSPPDLSPTSLTFRITQVAGGFTIKSIRGRSLKGAILEAEAAYEVRRGNAFNRYNENDFDLASSGINVSVAGATVDFKGGSKLRFEVIDDDFDVTVTGFDPQRDLAVRAKQLD